MDTALEILRALAAIASIVRLLLEAAERWRDYKQRRMATEDEKSREATRL